MVRRADPSAYFHAGKYGLRRRHSLSRLQGYSRPLPRRDLSDDVHGGRDRRPEVSDAQDEDALRDLDIGSFDHVYVSIGKNVEASIMVTLIAKELGAKDVICRAENANHARVLEKIGADQVVRPEHDLAKRLVFQQLNPGVIDLSLIHI